MIDNSLHLECPEYVLVLVAGKIVRAKKATFDCFPDGVYWSRGTNEPLYGPMAFYVHGTRIDGREFCYVSGTTFHLIQYKDKLRVIALNDALPSSVKWLQEHILRVEMALACPPADAGLYAGWGQ